MRELEAAYHRGRECFEFLEAAFAILSWEGSCDQCLGPFPCVVRGLFDLCSPVGQCGIKYFNF